MIDALKSDRIYEPLSKWIPVQSRFSFLVKTSIQVTFFPPKKSMNAIFRKPQKVFLICCPLSVYIWYLTSTREESFKTNWIILLKQNSTTGSNIGGVFSDVCLVCTEKKMKTQQIVLQVSLCLEKNSFYNCFKVKIDNLLVVCVCIMCVTAKSGEKPHHTRR